MTLRFVDGVGRLRRRSQHAAIRKALARTAKPYCRIVHYSIQSHHMHLLVEADDRFALARGMIAFKTSCARRLNAVAARRGRAFADRYHARYLKTAAETRTALAYVMNNWRRHGEDRISPGWRIDPFSSAAVFDGWTSSTVTDRVRRGRAPPVARARSWLLTLGWREYGAIHPREMPGWRTPRRVARRRGQRVVISVGTSSHGAMPS